MELKFKINENYGFSIYNDKDDKLIIPADKILKSGDQIYIYGTSFLVKETENGDKYVEDDIHMFVLETINDSRGNIWICGGIINKRGIKKLELIK